MSFSKWIRRRFKPQSGSRPVAVILQTMQDWDLAQPVLAAFASRGVAVRVIAQASLAKKRQSRLLQGLKAMRLTALPLPEDVDLPKAEHILRNCAALLSFSETSLRPHRFAHSLTLAANALGLPTYTMQHGFENVGLTYTDAVDRIEEVRMASQTVFVWCPQDDLHPQIDPALKARTLSVGCPKPAQPPVVRIAALETLGKPVVGIFENLHWHRYSDAYRAGFIKLVTEAASANPDLAFLIKPHSAARWLVKSGTDLATLPANIVIADPGQMPWRNYTAPQLFGHLRAVITTPSTVAMDAARAGLPVALIRLDLDLPLYEPLPQLSTTADINGFLGLPETAEKQANEAFLRRHLVAGNAAARIVEKIAEDLGAKA